MNKHKTSNLLRSIAFFLTSAILICTFGFTVDGWIVDEDSDQSANSPAPPFIDDGATFLPEDTTNEPSEPEIYIPEYINRLTGLECSENLAGNSHIAIATDSSGYYYGIYGSDILCEIPIEDGTRFLCILNDLSNLWKIGAIEPARKYISSIAAFFDAPLLSAGEDDKVDYPSCESINEKIDLSLLHGAYYTEFSDRVYTNHKLLDEVVNLSEINQSSVADSPFSFLDFGKDSISFDEKASNISINFDQEEVTELRFDGNTKEYSIYKSCCK